MPEMSAGTGLAPLLTYAFAVFGVLALLGLVLWFVRRSNGAPPARKQAPVRRLAVVDQIALDEKRKLVLVQRDGVQHLVILGGANELLVESGIVEGRGARRDWDVSALEAERELPAFPAAPNREAPNREAPSREAPVREMPARAAGRTVPEPRLPEPVARGPEPQIAAEPVFMPPRRGPAAARATAPAPEPQFDPVARAPRRPEPVAAPFVAAPAVTAAAIAAAPAFDTAPEPVLQPVPEPLAQAPAPVAEPQAPRGGGLLARLARKRPVEAEPAPIAAAHTDADTLADEARIAFSEPLPEMPSHAAPEPMIEPNVDFDRAADFERTEPAVESRHPAPEPEPANARAEPDMSRLFDMIVPDEPAPVAPAAPATPAAPVPEPAAAAPAEPAEAPRAAVKIDPFFASMAQRLEETLRRPINPPPPPATPSATSPAAPAPTVAPRRPEATAPEPSVAPPRAATPDELELEMASLLGRAPQR